MENKLTSKQTALFCSIILLTSKLLVLPSLFYETNNFSSLFVLIFILFIEILFLFFVLKIKQKYKKINFFNIFNQKLGKIIAKIIFFILFLFFLLKLIYILQESFTFLKQTLYTEATILIYLICVIPIVTTLAYKGLKAFGRTLEILYLIIIISLLFCSLIWISSISNISLAIFSNNGIIGFVNNFFTYSFWFSDFIFILIILDNIQFQKGQTKVVMTYAIFTGIILILFYFAYFYIYQTTSFLHANAILDIIQFATNYGAVGRFDIFAILTVMFIIYFQLGMFMFCASKCITKVFNFGQRAQPLILINIIAILTLLFFTNNENNVIIFYSSHLKYLSIFIMYIIPILFFIFTIKLKNNKKINKNNILEEKIEKNN